jgi:glycosyltransferase involved in cell wall biosynthesis
MCSYNGEKFIGRQLDSILAQTYRNLELIIVDDCSTDGTFNIISGYAKKDDRIKCFKNEVNLGFNKNFERAIKLTTGEFIAISDQDDIWLPQKIESLLNNIGDRWLIFSNSSLINDEGVVKQGDILLGHNPAKYGYKGLLLANFITGHTTLFRREFVDYFVPIPTIGFYDWWIGFIATYHQKITFLDEVLTQYRIHNGSVIQKRLKSDKLRTQENTTINNMLSAFIKYEYLHNTDKLFIGQLKNAFKKKLNGKRSIPLLRMICKHYDELFPYLKKRKGLSLLNFAFKYTRKVKN